MKRIFVILSIFVGLMVSGCSPVDNSNSNSKETDQQARAVSSIVDNQPIPDLGGYSFERQVVIETYIARNNTITTYSYLMTLNGQIIEICPSIGYPIPYSTQLSAPEKLAPNNLMTINGFSTSPENSVIPQSEPNGLYPPDNAAATLVQCVQSDGSVSPVYIEQEVMAFPYRINSDFQMTQIGDASFSVKVKK